MNNVGELVSKGSRRDLTGNPLFLSLSSGSIVFFLIVAPSMKDIRDPSRVFQKKFLEMSIGTSTTNVKV